jgi:sulfite exporter TauE/SafE
MSGFSKLVAIAGGTFIILVGILMVLGRRLEIRPCRFLEKNIIERDKKSIIILGLVTGLLPCAPLLAILSYVALISRSWPATLLYGLSFGIGTFLSPLILLVVLAGLIPKFLICKKAIFSRIFSYACGLIFIFLGLQLMVKAF